MGCLYVLEFASGKRYIGITERPLAARVDGHRRSVEAGSPLAVHNAWRKHGAPRARVLAYATGKTFLNELELRAVAAYGTFGRGGYNLTVGGDSAFVTPWIRARLLRAIKGKPLTLETRQKMSAVRKGRPHTAAWSANISAALRGRKLTPEHRAKTGAATRGRKHTEATRALMSERHLAWWAERKRGTK